MKYLNAPNGLPRPIISGAVVLAGKTILKILSHSVPITTRKYIARDTNILLFCILRYGVDLRRQKGRRDE
ncbi:MAG: hypothetical protein JRI41_08120 [Deltaproteobacteria bacterium]|nr:hypothetical protein [Deltaproteobacteria bacterium]